MRDGNGERALPPAGTAAPLFEMEPDGNLMRHCQCCGRLKHHSQFRKDADAPRRRFCKLYGDVLTMYGITCAEFYARYDDQGGKCAICQCSFPSKAEIDEGGVRAERGPVVDHDHDCSHVIHGPNSAGPKRCCKACVRGLLCPSCNTLEGFVLGARRDPRYQQVMKYQDDWGKHVGAR